MGCSDAGTRHLPVIVHRKFTHARITSPRIVKPTRLHPEYASAVTLPRISSESVKKMALAQR